MPAAVGSIGDRVGQRSAVLMLSKGLVAPMGALPSEYLAERVRSRAVACLGGPAHAKEAVSGTAALVLGSADEDLRSQLGEVFDEAGLVCERTADVTGVEMAGVAKNAAALAGGRGRVPHGMNAAGIATAEVWRECLDYAERPRRTARDLLRPRRGRRPDRDDPGSGQPQPPRGRAARQGTPAARSRRSSARRPRASTRCR